MPSSVRPDTVALLCPIRLRRWYRYTKWSLLILLLAALVGFAYNNRTLVNVSFAPFPMEYSPPVFMLIYGLLAGGVCVGAIMMSGYAWRMRRLMRQHHIQIGILTQTLESLRSTQRQVDTPEDGVPLQASDMSD